MIGFSQTRYNFSKLAFRWKCLKNYWQGSNGLFTHTRNFKSDWLEKILQYIDYLLLSIMYINLNIYMYIVYHVTGTLSLNKCTLKPHLSGFESSGEAKFQYPMWIKLHRLFRELTRKTPETPALFIIALLQFCAENTFLIQLLM